MDELVEGIVEEWCHPLDERRSVKKNFVNFKRVEKQREEKFPGVKFRTDEVETRKRVVQVYE